MMTNSFYINMSLNLKRTKIYFLTVAIFSFVIIFISYNWNIPENIYKTSSEISKVRISNLQLNDIEIREHIWKASTKYSDDRTTTRLDNKSAQTEGGVKWMNSTNVSYVGTKDINKTVDETISKNIITSGKEVLRDKHVDIKNSTESQGSKSSVDQNIRKGSSKILKVKEKVVNKQTTNSNSVNSTFELINNDMKEENENMISHGNIKTFLSNETKTSFDKIQNSKVETNEVLREIHRLKDKITSQHKSSVLQRNKPLKSKFQVLRKNNSFQLNTKRDMKAFNRIRNRLKHLGRVNTGFMPLQNKGLSSDNQNTAEYSDVTSRPDDCTGCFEKNFKKMINQPTLCDGDVDLLFVVTSTFSRQDSRNAIRSTWCAHCNKPNSKMKLVFVFGNKNDTIENINLQAESLLYHDIIQFDFHDTYANLTYKTITSLQWSDDYCKKAKFVMKTDDDMYVNTELLQLMLKAAASENLIGGMCWGPSSPHRDLSSKWYVSFVQYRHSFFPSMCSGTGYVMSRDVVSGILRESPNVPFFYLEDVYVAICVKRLGVTPLLLDGFKNQRVNFEPCIYRNRIITAHEMSADSLKDFWEQSRTCPKENLSPQIVYRPIPV